VVVAVLFRTTAMTLLLLVLEVGEALVAVRAQ
jgi:hypothetical protein